MMAESQQTDAFADSVSFLIASAVPDRLALIIELL
jgi:hypothetical protein